MARYIKPATFPLWARKNNSNTSDRYYLYKDGIKCDFDSDAVLPYANHIEMSGFRSSVILSYRINRKRIPYFYRFCIFPSKRILPDDTRGSLVYTFDNVSLNINKKEEKTESVFFNGVLHFFTKADDAKIERRFIAGNDKCTLVEEIKIIPKSSCTVSFSCKKSIKTVDGKYTPTGKPYRLKTRIFSCKNQYTPKMQFDIDKESVFYIAYAAEHVTYEDVLRQISLRENFIKENRSRLKIITPDDEINKMLEFTKLRASESIFETKNGLMHAPGGGQYYAALWTNDQCEYANPFFAYLGYDKACEQSLNCYHLYSRLAKEDEAIFTSIVAQGDDYWHGAGDRGDSSMFVYGFSRYLLTTGDKENAKKYICPLETVCKYIMSKMNSNGVIESDSDELENRFESGKANLSTAVISLDAFRSMSYLESELGNSNKANEYLEFSNKIENGIHSYFEADVEGFETYRYCAEENKLRSWICLPLTVGIFNRVDGTLAALSSDKLKKPCGLLTRSGSQTYWDRSLLYALRGIFYAGESGAGIKMLKEYTHTRLLGEHCPYPIEAYPEGNAAHLSAESALYNRILTEGILGYRPLGFKSFEIKPNLPVEWNCFEIKNMELCGEKFNIKIKNENENAYILNINNEEIVIHKGSKYICSLSEIN